jgi:DNA-binding transcriptional ArsR family regulator
MYMTITFHLPSNALERIAFAYSPLLEAVLSLHVLIEPKHHPIQHPWVRQMQQLSPTLKREITAFSFAYRSYFPAFLFPNATGNFATFEQEVARLSQITPTEISFEFTLPLCTGVLPFNQSRVHDEKAQATILQRAAAIDPATNQLARLALEEPMVFLDRFVHLLAAYWDAAFAREWQRVEELLATSVTEAGQALAAFGLYDFLQELWPEVRTDRNNECFWLDRPHEHAVTIDQETHLVLMPSAYVWPHVRVNCDPPWPICLVFPALSIARAARPRIPPDDMLRALRALADDTRLRILRLLSERSRSTQELAPLVGVSDAALSKHLRLLANVGVVQAHRQGYYVLYSLVPDQLAAVTNSVHSYLRGSVAVPPTPTN